MLDSVNKGLMFEQSLLGSSLIFFPYLSEQFFASFGFLKFEIISCKLFNVLVFRFFKKKF